MQSVFEINISADGGKTFLPVATFSDDTAPSGSLYTLSFSSPATLPKGALRLSIPELARFLRNVCPRAAQVT